jgi:peroxidase
MASSASWFCSLLALFLVFSGTYGQLSPNFYSLSCPTLLSVVSDATSQAILAEKRMGASLLRLHFHDCFVQVRAKLGPRRFLVKNRSIL